MNIKNGNFVTLSRRNLETLLKMLDLQVGSPTLHRQCLDGTVLTVKAEENDTHYDSEDRQERVRGKQGIGPEDVRADIKVVS